MMHLRQRLTWSRVSWFSLVLLVQYQIITMCCCTITMTLPSYSATGDKCERPETRVITHFQQLYNDLNQDDGIVKMDTDMINTTLPTQQPDQHSLGTRQ